MQFTDYQYLWPPRPEEAVPDIMLAAHEIMGFVAQIKKNGTCSVIAVSPSKEIITMNRHQEAHKAWQPTGTVMDAFRALPGDGWYVFVAELLHSKVPGLRNVNYIFDLLVDNGDYLVSSTFMDRQARLSALFPHHVSETFSHYVIDKHTWLAKIITTDFLDVWQGLDAPEDEGIVLKDATARLAMCSRPTANSNWQVKCRKPHKNFSF